MFDVVWNIKNETIPGSFSFESYDKLLSELNLWWLPVSFPSLSLSPYIHLLYTLSYILPQ